MTNVFWNNSDLLVFATEMERDAVFPNGIVTGIGILSTAINLPKVFVGATQRGCPYKRAIQIGIAGAYRSSGLNIGDVVEVESDCMPEFLPWEPHTFFATDSLGLKRVKGATVLSCTKTEEVGAARGQDFQIETMEGAAFFAVCKEYGVQAIQVRAISNFAGFYDKSKWEIERALKELSSAIVR
ncbi:MAG: hypothetical protein FWC15_05240 [Fibromonadales bacterium]|nr:hypothetical protein [Fibromonadales bacterium]